MEKYIKMENPYKLFLTKIKVKSPYSVIATQQIRWCFYTKKI